MGYMTLIIAELWEHGDCLARWTDENGPSNLAALLPELRGRGWTIHDFRGYAGHAALKDTSATDPAPAELG